MKTCTKCKTEKSLDQFQKDHRYTGGYTTHCKQCRKAANRANYYANHEKRLARYKKYRAENIEEVNRRKREGRALKRQETNALHRKYRAANKDKERERQRRWRAENPEKVLEANFRRRVRKAAATRFYVAPKELRRILDQRCLYCGTVENITIEHVVPLFRGGTHSIGNLAPACGKCNSSKGARFISEWKITKRRDTANLV